ncbi:MAG: hypothetical protein SWL02_08915 [Pseudomonadota bacterium]|nr:hypothetical protein [Pseudomonadota bacterium]|tara:strand:+ start:1069 stop:1512 length:444 start_codon:yes stop_codon:yes gene_type:complete
MPAQNNIKVTEFISVAIATIALLFSIYTYFDINFTPLNIEGAWKSDKPCKNLFIIQIEKTMTGSCITEDKQVSHSITGVFVNSDEIEFAITRELVNIEDKKLMRSGVIKVIDSNNIEVIHQPWIGSIDLLRTVPDDMNWQKFKRQLD